MSRFLTTVSLALTLGIATVALAACDSGGQTGADTSNAQPASTQTTPTGASQNGMTGQSGDMATDSQTQPDTATTTAPKQTGTGMNSDDTAAE